MKKITIIFMFLLLLPSLAYAASDFDLEKIDFRAIVDEYGNMQVQETWQVDIDGETNTLFKTFETDKSITNVTVTEVTNGVTRNFQKSYQLQYHVDTDRFYAMKNAEGNFEIAWGVNKSSGDRTYIINYTFVNAVDKYNDCAQIYWQCIGKDFSSPISEVTGTITLPRNVKTLDNLRVWGHGQLNGEVQRTSNNTVSFEVAPYITGTFVEIRTVVLEPEMFTGVLSANKNKLNNIIEEETAWAEEANRQREVYQRKQKTIYWGSIIISTIISLILIKQILKAWKVIKSTPKLEPSMKLDYFRDIPNEQSSPSEVGFLYYFGKVGMQSIMPKVLSATMLDLALKKLVSFEMTADKKPEVIVKIKQDSDTSILKPSEEKIYTLLKKVAGADGSFNVKEIEKYASKHNSSFLSTLSAIEKEARKEQEEQANYNAQTRKKHDSWIAKGSALPVAVIFIGIFLFGILEIPLIALGIVAVISIIYAIFCFTAAGRFSGLTQKGIDEQEQWEGLKKYMEDFSMLDKREVPELVLWEKYLVYATLFGNAEKVLKQLKVVYPEFSNDDYMMNTTYFYLMAHTDFSNSFVRAVDSSMQRAYNSSIAASSSSSGGGYGGGFSGGGGGGFGGGRRRWTLKETPKFAKNV